MQLDRDQSAAHVRALAQRARIALQVPPATSQNPPTALFPVISTEAPTTPAALRSALLSAQSAAVGLTGDAQALGGLQGQGGIGKTVLARRLARDWSVGLHFPDGTFWVTLGEAGDPVAAQLDLLVQLGVPHMGLRTASEARERLREVMRDRRCLVIVDDVWSADAALALTATGPAGRTLYTTRDQAVLEAIGARVEWVDAFPAAAARELLAAVAGTTAERLPPDAGRMIAATDRSRSLALAAAASAHGRSWAEIAEELAREFGHLSRPSVREHVQGAGGRRGGTGPRAGARIPDAGGVPRRHADPATQRSRATGPTCGMRAPRTRAARWRRWPSGGCSRSRMTASRSTTSNATSRCCKPGARRSCPTASCSPPTRRWPEPAGRTSRATRAICGST